MKNFYITFPLKYATKPHPRGGHPDGWFRVVAEDIRMARYKAYIYMGTAWASAYAEEDFNRAHYPAGELKEIK